MKLPCEHCCQEPTYKHAEQQEQPYRGLWQAIVSRVAEMPDSIPIYKGEIDRWMREIWEEQPDAAEAFALNTTRYGRDSLTG